MQMVSLTPEVIIAGGAAPTRALQQATHTIPIIITQGGDVAANGLVKDIAHPEGNITGFTSSEPTIAGKWLELLKAAVPSVRDSRNSARLHRDRHQHGLDPRSRGMPSDRRD